MAPTECTPSQVLACFFAWFLCMLSLRAVSLSSLFELSLWALLDLLSTLLSPLFGSLLSPLLSEPSLKLCISWSLSLSLSWALSRALSSHILHTTFPHPSHAFLSSIALFESFYKAGINKVHTHTDGQRSNIPSSWAPVGVKKLLEITDKWIRKYHHHQPSKLLFNALFAWLILRDIFLVILDISLKKKQSKFFYLKNPLFSDKNVSWLFPILSDHKVLRQSIAKIFGSYLKRQFRKYHNHQPTELLLRHIAIVILLSLSTLVPYLSLTRLLTVCWMLSRTPSSCLSLIRSSWDWAVAPWTDRTPGGQSPAPPASA